MKLYGSLTSPYTRKLRVVILEKQLPIEFVEVPAATDPQVAARNPLGKVPVLERDDGSALFDSPVAAEFLDTLAAPALIPAAGEARWQTLRWAALADGIMDATVLRMMETRRPAALQSADAMKHQEGKILRAIDFAERELRPGPWLLEDRLTFADIAFAVALDYVDFRYPNDWRSSHMKLTRWHAGLSSRPSFVQTHPPAPKQ
jgi:glutathione S-transferase